jgi:hypothetical protein
MNERLSPSDMSSLLAERGVIHVHVGATILLEGEPPDFDRLLDHVDARLALVPRFRQRVKSTLDLGTLVAQLGTQLGVGQAAARQRRHHPRRVRRDQGQGGPIAPVGIRRPDRM